MTSEHTFFPASRRHFLTGSALLAFAALAGGLKPLSLTGLRQSAERTFADEKLLTPDSGTALLGRELCLWCIDCRSFRFESFERLVKEIVQSTAYTRLPYTILVIRDDGQLTEEAAAPAASALNLLQEFGFPALASSLRAEEFDREFAMIGSANHNERSMWHDTEDMLAVQASERHSVPADLRRQLMNTVLAGQMTESEDAQEIFNCFTKHLQKNGDAYLLGMTQQSFVFPYIPGTAVGCRPIS